MTDREQEQRERAYKIGEDEGRPDGAHDHHWKRAERAGDLVAQETDDVTKVNQQADDEFANSDWGHNNAADVRPPSTVAPD
ncbi:hypothetical protein J2T09_004831 [Neorhizobium huautlense]|uniref:DUF2934 domain-containing protein n=1 Tax=Neorhizobium huautlense TaxID=67774 RepID=A0ABT9Q0Z5_9HYPH|nr:DUF2934 domain-containing protein [Neorhizobium huautlense]MDP9840051.1 hypothetical protein [Neorhizobium huautlense]